MKVKTETHTIASRVSLTKEEVCILKSAQEIIDEIWNKLEKADNLSPTTQGIYNSIDEIGGSLEIITSLVDVEN